MVAAETQECAGAQSGPSCRKVQGKQQPIRCGVSTVKRYGRVKPGRATRIESMLAPIQAQVLRIFQRQLEALLRRGEGNHKGSTFHLCWKSTEHYILSSEVLTF